MVESHTSFLYMKINEFDAQSLIDDWKSGDRTGTILRYKSLPDSAKFYFGLAAGESGKFTTRDCVEFHTMLAASEMMGNGGVWPTVKW